MPTESQEEEETMKKPSVHWNVWIVYIEHSIHSTSTCFEGKQGENVCS